MSKPAFYLFLPAGCFALFLALGLVTFIAFDPAPFQPFFPFVFISLVTLFLFIGLFGLVFRKTWALRLHLVVWIVFMLFMFYAYFVDARNEKTFFPQYFWLYEQAFYYFTASILSCWFGLWRCKRLKRQQTTDKNGLPREQQV